MITDDLIKLLRSFSRNASSRSFSLDVTLHQLHTQPNSRHGTWDNFLQKNCSPDDISATFTLAECLNKYLNNFYDEEDLLARYGTKHEISAVWWCLMFKHTPLSAISLFFSPECTWVRGVLKMRLKCIFNEAFSPTNYISLKFSPKVNFGWFNLIK